ncbi:MAG: glycosyltransferase [Deltaproteobacteria bacterium]|nr:glycosyltransferase [Deltaproteobacteria bacterium]
MAQLPLHSARSTQLSRGPEISVVLSVRDDEDLVGHQIRTIAAHLESLRRTFEIVAVNDGSCDNSLAMLELLAARTPELRIIRGNSAGRAFLRGAAEARGDVVVLCEGARPLFLAALGWALGRLEAGREAVILRGRYIVARRLLTLPIIVRATGPGLLFERVFEQRAQDLGIDVIGSRPAPQSGMSRLLTPVLRFLAA